MLATGSATQARYSGLTTIIHSFFEAEDLSTVIEYGNVPHLTLLFLNRIMLVLGLVSVALVAASKHEYPTVEVKLEQGSILGSWEKAPNGSHYFTFRAIPYAKAPIGSLRFKVRDDIAFLTGCLLAGRSNQSPANGSLE